MQTISIPALAEASGGARDAQVRETWLGVVRLGVVQAQPPCPAPSRGSPEGRRGGEAARRGLGSLRLVRPWGCSQLFITSVEHSASACARA